MDAFLTDLPLPVREYLHWLRQSHFSTDDWNSFERALAALDVYNAARGAADTHRLAAQTNESVFNDSCSANRAPVRQRMFSSLSRQIIAQEEFCLMVRLCEEQYRCDGGSSDIARLLDWLRARLGESEAQVSAVLGYRPTD
ncbi:MAG: hypothetical protein V2I57_16055 [Xanthomonadales bacterium]|nr:hypothetical protein [Xanthomonadales bacterium]